MATEAMSGPGNSRLRVLSLGWGVQSWTLAAMMALDEIPRVDYLIHADTTYEREATYAFAERWTPWLREHGLDVVTVRSDRTQVPQYWHSRTAGIMIPAFTKGPDGKAGQLNRQCTGTWKIRVIRKFVSEELKRRGWSKRPGTVATMMGISLDEWTRMRDSDVKYVINEYPLIDRRLTRQDCMAWLDRNGLPRPVKSACLFCPFHSRAEWKRLYKEGGRDWEVAVRVDEAIRNERDKFPLFVHPLRRPLQEAVQDDGQMEMWPEATCDSGYCFT